MSFNVPPTVPHKSVLGYCSDIYNGRSLSTRRKFMWVGRGLPVNSLSPPLKLPEQSFSVTWGCWSPIFPKACKHKTSHCPTSTCLMTSQEAVYKSKELLHSLLRKVNAIRHCGGTLRCIILWKQWVASTVCHLHLDALFLDALSIK